MRRALKPLQQRVGLVEQGGGRGVEGRQGGAVDDRQVEVLDQLRERQQLARGSSGVCECSILNRGDQRLGTERRRELCVTDAGKRDLIGRARPRGCLHLDALYSSFLLVFVLANGKDRSEGLVWKNLAMVAMRRLQWRSRLVL